MTKLHEIRRTNLTATWVKKGKENIWQTLARWKAGRMECNNTDGTPAVPLMNMIHSVSQGVGLPQT
jgi:hypothetical protein